MYTNKQKTVYYICVDSDLEIDTRLIECIVLFCKNGIQELIKVMF